MIISKTYVLSFYSIIKKIFLVSINLLFLGVALTFFIHSVWELHFKKPQMKNIDKKHFVIQKNQSCLEIAKELESNDIISSKNIFKKWAVIWGLDRDLKAGKYIFTENKTLFQVMTKLSNYISFTDKITIREGLTIDEIGNRLESLDVNKTIFLSLCYDKNFISDLNINESSLEGYLFPDTYQISYGESEKNIIKMMVKRFFNVINDIDIKRSLIYKTSGLKKGLIIGSIIEKESRYIPERPQISSVFWNRFNNNWRLDSDVTVHYAIKDWKKKLTKRDLKISSPYNTRKYKGLPPTPICNPGKSSIKAAFFPDKTNYMFFIAAGNKKGSSIFTSTLRKHNIVKKDLKKKGKL